MSKQEQEPTTNREQIISYFTGEDIELYRRILEEAKRQRRSISSFMLVAAEHYLRTIETDSTAI